MEPKNFGLLAKILWQKCKNWLIRVHTNILRNFFGKKIHPFWFWGEFFWPHTKLFFPGFSELHSTCPKETFEESFSEKKPPLPDTEWKTFALLLNLVQRCCQNCILRVRRETLGWDSFIEKMCFLHLLRTLSQKIWSFWQKFDGGVLKTTSYVSLRTNWGFIFQKKISIVFGLSVKKICLFPKSFRGVHQSCFLLVRRNSSRSFFQKNVFFHLFRTLLESWSNSSGKVSAGLWNFVTTCPEKHFEEKRFFPSKMKFFKTSRCSAKVFRKL